MTDNKFQESSSQDGIVPKLGRRAIREHIFKLLFQSLFWNEEEFPDVMELYLSRIEDIDQEDKDTIRERTRKALLNTTYEDDLINRTAKGWKTTRMNKADLSILRLAICEIRFEETIPDSVAINEAVELARKFSSDESSSFVNGILASIMKEDQ